MPRFNLSRFPVDLEESATPRLYIQGTVSHAGHGLTYLASCEGDDALPRALGCMMISAMPNDAMDEIVVYLRDLLAFYNNPAFLAPAVEHEFHRHTGAVVGKGERPKLLLAGEER